MNRNYFSPLMAACSVSLFLLIGCQGGSTDNKNNSNTAVTTQKEEEGFPKPIYNDSSKVIYLTFDDGPLPGSEAYNTIITEKKIRATAFVVGKHVKLSQSRLALFDNYRKNPYMEVCNHSFSHANNQYDAYYGNPEKSAQEIMDNEKDLGLQEKIVRLPGRPIWKLKNRELNMKMSGSKTAQILFDNGFRMFGWDGEWARTSKGEPKMNAQEVIKMIEDNFAQGRNFTPNHYVLLAHDEMLKKPEHAQYLREIIDYFKGKGYLFEYLNNYPDVKDESGRGKGEAPVVVDTTLKVKKM